MIKNTDLAYAAGYIDGNGCFYIEKCFVENRFKYRCFMAINSNEIENLQWFQKIFGGTLLTGGRGRTEQDDNSESVARAAARWRAAARVRSACYSPRCG